MTALCDWQKGNGSGDDFSQVRKVSQIKTKGEIKDSLFKAIDYCTECAQWIVQLLHYGHSVV